MKSDKQSLTGTYSQSDFLPEDESQQGAKSSEKLKNRKVLAIAGLVVLLIAGLAIGLGVGLSRKGDKDNSASPPQDSNVPLNVQKLCAGTEFSDVCEPALSSLPGAATASNEQLVSMAVMAAVNLMKSLNDLAIKLQTSSNNPNVRKAASLCAEPLAESMDFLNSTSINLDAILSGNAGANSTETIDQLVAAVNAASTGNKDCAIELFDFTTAGNGANVSADTDLAFQYASNAAMAMENAAGLLAQLPGLSKIIAAWQAQQQAILESGYNATLLDAGAFGVDNVGPNAAGSRRLLRELAFEDDDSAPAWARRRLLQSFPKPDATVDGSGKGNYEKVQDAVDAICGGGSGQGTIFVRPGTYKEKVIVPKKCRLTVYGDRNSAAKTIITNSDNTAIKGTPTFQTATFNGKGDNLVLAYLTIQNTAGPEGHQAVALRLAGIHQVVYKCYILGYQDTLYVHKGIHYVRESSIAGTVDFIFGNGASFFDRCTIRLRASSSTGTFDTITAQGRTAASQATGLVFGSCTVVADGNLKKLLSKPDNLRIYMGRPWKPYSRVVFALSDFGNLISDQHWVNWDGTLGKLPSTVFYAEFQNKGVNPNGANPGTILLNRKTLRPFLISNFINGNAWLGKTGIPLN